MLAENINKFYLRRNVIMPTLSISSVLMWRQMASGVDATSYPDLSVAASTSVDPGAYYANTTSGSGTSIRNPSISYISR